MDDCLTALRQNIKPFWDRAKRQNVDGFTRSFLKTKSNPRSAKFWALVYGIQEELVSLIDRAFEISRGLVVL